jgi:uncharacterized C2H2 Zn-finger protein
MDAHQVLGLPPSATLDDAEDAYKRLLRIHHPDLHQHDGPGALAAAELRTAAINAAIAHFRRVARSTPAGGVPYRGFDPTAWENDPEDDLPQVSCPLCDEFFTTAGTLRAHVTEQHEMRFNRTRPARRLPRVPSVSLALFVPLNALVALLACTLANRATGSAAIAVWVLALTLAPTAIRVMTPDN